MSELLINSLLFVIVISALLSLLHPRLFVSVILLSIFSFLSALLFYVAHAPDVAITEAAVGAGMTTFIFIWAVRGTGWGEGQMTEEPRQSSKRTRRLLLILDLSLVLLTGITIFLLLPPLDGGPELLRDYLVKNGYAETGALNLVSAVYLGYRAFDTFGETIVLLCAVSGSVFLLSERR